MAIKEKEKNGKVWFQIDVRRRSSKNPAIRVQKYRRASTLEEAKSLQEILEDEAMREVIRREECGLPWRQIIEEWETALFKADDDDRGMLKTTAHDKGQALRSFTQVWWDLPVEEITRADVKEVLAKMKQDGYSKSRRRAVKAAITSVFNWASDNRRIKRNVENPAHGIELGRDEEKRPEILSLTEIRKLLEAALLYKHPWYPMWAMALHTGMRSGELHALLWTDVDFESREINVNKTYNGRMKKTKPTKGGYWRNVPINTELEELLKTLRVESQVQGRFHVLPRMNDWDRGEAARILRQFCEGIGVTSVKFHTLRACFGTQLIRDRVAPGVVMKIAGWKDLKTMQGYIRLAGIEIQGATDGLKFLTPQEAMGKVVSLFGPKPVVD